MFFTNGLLEILSKQSPVTLEEAREQEKRLSQASKIKNEEVTSLYSLYGYIC